MMERFDPFAVLRDLNPVDLDDVGDAASSPEARATLEQILAGTRRPKLRVFHSAAKRMFVLVALAFICAVAAVALALTQGAAQHLTVGCYQTASLEAKTVVIATRGGSVVETCRQLWRQQRLGGPVPVRLQACRLPSGAIGVFPSLEGRACADLNLSALRDDEPATGSTAQLREALVDVFLARGCISQKHAGQLVRDELRRQGIADWTVADGAAFTSERPCASLGFDEPHRVVLLVPMARP
jgi:hypothetical protein